MCAPVDDIKTVEIGTVPIEKKEKGGYNIIIDIKLN